MIYVCLNMLYILVLCPVLLASPVLTLTIDNRLGTSVEDCFERISIGEQLCVDAIYRNATELSTKECEQQCKQDTLCQTYDYGVGAKGNASCNLSKLNLTELQDSKMIQKHSDYDVYVRRLQCDQSQPLNQPQTESPPIKTNPGESERNPQADDLSPHETTGPDTARPGNKRPGYGDSDRPDGYDSSRPSYDSPPAYGMHRPQDIPFRPDSFHRPGQSDEMTLQNPNWRPPRPNDKIPDIYRPNPYPEYVPEVPQYVYIERPFRRQHRPSSCSQNTKPEDSQADSVGNKPEPERPDRPYDRPTYTGQYASNYGTSHDNSIYLEIVDPPRPIRPMADDIGHDSTGYGQEYDYASQNSYSQHSSQSWNGYQYKPSRPYRNPQLDHGPNYEYDDRYRPTRPIRPSVEQYGQSYNQASYSESHSQNYASSHGYYGSYGNDRPSQGENRNQSNFIDRLSDSQGSYGSSQNGDRYINGQTSYGSQNGDRYNMNGQSSYGSQNGDRYMNGQSSYGSQNGDRYMNGQSSYGSQNGDRYMNGQSSYGSQNGDRYMNGQSSYGSQNGDRYMNGQSSYGSQIGDRYNYPGPSIEEINKYNYEHGIYGTHLGYGTHHLYGITPGMYGPSYRPADRPSFNDKRPGQAEVKPQASLKPVDDRTNQTNTTASLNSDRANSSRPDVKPVYEQDRDRPYNVPSYLVTSNGNVVTSKPVAVSDYRPRPGYREEVTYEGKMLWNR